MGLVLVQMFHNLQCHIRCLDCVGLLEHQQLGVIEDRDKLVLELRVDNMALVVLMSCFGVFA